MSVKLVEVTRGKIVETSYRGDVVVVDIAGNILFKAGNPLKITYMRSAAKPLQAINVILSGAYKALGLTSHELAVICSSHYAEPFHLKSVASILEKAGLQNEHVKGGIVTSFNPQYALQLARNGTELTPLFSDCSGKHAGMLAVCSHKKYSLHDYLSPQHPCQQEILAHMSYMCDVPAHKFMIGIDGCSAPVHAFPLFNMALGYARLANPDKLIKPYKLASHQIFDAMVSHPEMISGTGGFCTGLMKASNGKLIGKVGAEGIYCVGVKNRNLGFAIKIESGSMAMLPPVVIKILQQLDVLSANELKALSSYEVMNNLNDIGTTVGFIRPVFQLKK